MNHRSILNPDDVKVMAKRAISIFAYKPLKRVPTWFWRRCWEIERTR